jgi:hypothetical protein
MVCAGMGEEDALAADEGLLFGWDGGGREVARGLGVVVAEDDGFVDGEPFGDTGVVAGEDYAGVVDEVRDDVLAEPASIEVLEEEREVPVVEGDNGLNSVLQASVDEIIVVGESLLVDRAAAEGEDARPRDGEGVGWYS